MIIELCLAAAALCPSGPQAPTLPIPDDYVFVIDGDISPTAWNRLIDVGYRGRTGDGADALYVSEQAVLAVAADEQDAMFVQTYMSYPGTVCSMEHKSDPDIPPTELICTDQED